MGAVYLAEHPLIGKKVALKVIHKDLATSRDVVERFFQEARAVTKIGHEHIVEIHDFGVTPDGDHFYIMEYLEGKTLASVLGREGRLEVRRAQHVGAQIASALGAAHAAGVIHRDLKPDNVMLIQRLGDPDFVKLLDFGLAKMAAGDGSAVKTAAGVLLGTPQYMSPEACETRGIDHRTDIYALGVLLFQMMTGVLPFDGESMGEVLVKQVTLLPPAPRAVNPQIPPSVEQIVLRCLMKSPDARFATMAALRDALMNPEGYLGASPPMAPARSIPPGQAPVDAKTVIAFAAAQQEANAKKTKLGMSLPLPAPVPSMVGGPGAGAGAGVAPGMIGSAPDLVVPNAPKMNTMRIGTPLGYSSRPVRRMWPVVIGVGLVLGLGGGAIAVAVFGGKRGAGSGSGGGAGGGTGAATATATATATGSGMGVGHGSGERYGSGYGSGSATMAAAGSGEEGQRGSGEEGQRGSGEEGMASVEIDSVPAGAEVVREGKALGVTPLALSLPVSGTAIELQIEHAGYRARTEKVVVRGNLVLQVPLEPVARPRPQPKPGGKDTDLMRPDDL